MFSTIIIEYYPAGETVSISYKWNEQGTFNIRVKAQDKYGVWSDWSDSLPVSMPNNKSVKTLGYLESFKNLYQRFPVIYRIFSQNKIDL